MENSSQKLNFFRRLMLFVLVLVCSVTLATAQTVTVSGNVSDQSGEPLIGASIVIKGQNTGVTSDLDGNYTIANVPADATLVYSYVGYLTFEDKVKGRTKIDVILSEDQQLLDEVVVVGYGSLSRREITSSIVQVDKAEFNQGGMNNAMQMINGKVAGLNVSTTAAADPNGSSSLQIRGATSLSAENGPLIVIDGVAGGDIRTLAPQDIESMSVLKDAASSAIYGTRGANGVILITTKRGSGNVGKPVVTYDSYIALNFAKDKPDVLTPDEWRRARRGNDFGYSTDWYKEITRETAYDTNQYLSIDGTTTNGYYMASVNYKRANGLDIVSGREEFGGRAAVSESVLDNHLTLTASLNARKVNEKWGDGGMFDTAMGMNPTMPIYNEDGTYYQPTSPTDIKNPVQQLKVNTSQGHRTYILGTTDVRYNIWSNEKHNISTTLSYSYNYNDLKSDYYTPSTSGESYWGGYKGRASIQYQKWWTNRLEWLGNYGFHSGDHDVKVLLGYTWERSDWEQMFEQNNDFTFDNMLWHGIGSGSYLKDGKANMYAGKSQSTLVGFFGRVNYSWKNMPSLRSRCAMKVLPSSVPTTSGAPSPVVLWVGK